MAREEERDFVAQISLADLAEILSNAMTSFAHKEYIKGKREETHHIVDANIWSPDTCYHERHNRLNKMLSDNSEDKVRKAFKLLDYHDLEIELQRVISYGFPWGCNINLYRDDIEERDRELEVRVFDYSLISDVYNGYCHPKVMSVNRNYHILCVKHRAGNDIMNKWMGTLDKMLPEIRKRIDAYHNNRRHLLSGLQMF